MITLGAKTLEANLKSLEGLEAKVQIPEDPEAIQKLQKAYGYYLEHMMVEDIVEGQPALSPAGR
jgi:hypothetical protein